jgi:hypothetical protein
LAVTVIVGGQFGSEGKGKIAAYLAPEIAMAIRTGGPNAGHTIEHEGDFCKLQSVPCAFINPSCTLALGAGAVIDESVLQAEINRLALAPSRLVIDPQAHNSTGSLVRRAGASEKNRINRKRRWRRLRREGPSHTQYDHCWGYRLARRLLGGRRYPSQRGGAKGKKYSSKELRALVSAYIMANSLMSRVGTRLQVPSAVRPG